MTYVTDQTSAELRVHMRSLKRMQGWHEPLADRLFKEVVEQDATIKKLEGALAAAEARNATLTDDAARAERNRDMWKDQCAGQAKQLEALRPIERRYLWLRDRTAAPSWYAAHANMGISCEVFDMRLDAEIARAAASISTEGDGS